jgi:tRNA modification GTPase
MHPRDQTIFALSSGRLPSAIALVRVSGPQAGLVLTTLAGKLPAPRQASRRLLRDGASQPIDDAVVLWFPGPGTATGEDVAEFHVHGGRAVLAALLAAISLIPNTRAAEPGEFTRRAFENGRLDLTAVEGLADLIAAETPAQRRQAFRQLKGLIGARAEAWRRTLIEALALVEARIDFADEGDVPDDLVGPAVASVARLREEIAAALADGRRGERLRDGIVIAIAGPPNAGKSTLLNRLARREAAIVSPYPGTTRDVIEVHMDLDGFPATLLDTAGVRQSDDPVEREGVRRAEERAQSADLVLWVTDLSADGGAVGDKPKYAAGSDRWIVDNKVDLVVDKRCESRASRPTADRPPTFAISALTGTGVDGLVAALATYARGYFATTESAIVTRARHRRALEETVAALDRCLAESPSGREELVAEELRAAATTLGRLTGRVDVEDILDVIFRDFCIGK